MKNKIQKYIDTEKDLSRYKIKLLALTDKSYSVRLIKKENDFIEYDFSKIHFSDIDECRKAISLFKISKYSFIKVISYMYYRAS